MAGPEIERLVQLLAKLPGLGPRSARRAALTLIKRREQLLDPLAGALAEAAAKVKTCHICGNYDSVDPCTICTDERRDTGIICVVDEVSGLWAMERSGLFRGLYHVLGGVLSPLDGIGPDDLAVGPLVTRAGAPGVREVILALSATVDGQTTAHYLADRLAPLGVTVSGLAQGVPVGGELDYLDEGTIGAALRARREIPR
ncbi:MAG: recombination protein RecR [Telmatospirillum sp.]|nr:recombination protein RecR [Telmatospirillum sp.]